MNAQHYFDKMVAAAHAIGRHPHSRRVKDIKNMPVQRARQVDGRALSRMMRKPVARAGAKLPNTGISLPERVPGIVSQVTFDTPENRYVKALLLETHRSLRHLIAAETVSDSGALEEKLVELSRPEAEAMLHQVQVLLRAPYLKEVETVPPKHPLSTVFHQRPHYAAFVRNTQLLNTVLAEGAVSKKSES